MCEGDITTDPKALKAYTNFKDGNNIVLQAFSDMKPNMEEEEGWVSYEYRQKAKREAFSFNIDKKSSDGYSRFITVILPVENSKKIPAIDAKFENKSFNEKSIGITVKIGKDKYKLGYNL